MGTNRLKFNLEPVSRFPYWYHLGRQMKLWHRYGLSDSHCNKLWRLWVGYEFMDLMDENGRYLKQHYNEIRLRLSYASTATLLADIRRCRSFFLTGTDNNAPTLFFSSLWHRWEVSDGQLLPGSCELSETDSIGMCTDTENQKMSQEFDGYLNIINKIK